MMKKTVFLVSAATWVVTGLAATQPDFDAVEMTAYPVAGQVSYVEGRLVKILERPAGQQFARLP